MRLHGEQAEEKRKKERGTAMVASSSGTHALSILPSASAVGSLMPGELFHGGQRPDTHGMAWRGALAQAGRDFTSEVEQEEEEGGDRRGR